MTAAVESYSNLLFSPKNFKPQLLEHTERAIFQLQSENKVRLDPAFLAIYRGRQPAWGFGALSYAVYARTYARPLEDEGRNEQFWETLKRVTEGTFSILRQRIRQTGQRWDVDEAQTKAQDFFRRMWDFKFLPSGRMLWFMGSEALEIKGGAPLANCAFVTSKDLDVDFVQPFCMLMDLLMIGTGVGFDVRGAGKVTIRQPILTTSKHVVDDSREGWIEALRIMLGAFVGIGSIPEFDFSAIRPAGTPLRTFGGTASGSKPLEDLLMSTFALLMKLIGQPITSGAIVDINNFIGRCVVSGNIRRSSELALGEPDDAEFMSLKNPANLYWMLQRQREVAASLPEWNSLELERMTVRQMQKGLSLLAPEFASLQDHVDRIEDKQKGLLAANSAWQALEVEINEHPLRTHRWASNNTVMCERGHDYRQIAERIADNGEPGVMWLENMRQYGRMADPQNGIDARVLGTNPCSEISLESAETCLVPETFPMNHASLDDYKQTLRMAYILGKTITCVPTHDPAINEVVNRNRRLGISMAGAAALYEKLGMHRFIGWLDESYKHLRKLDKSYSGWMGVPESIKLTSVKPGGSTPILAGQEGGMKFPTAEHYFRTVRFAEDSPLLPQLSAAGYRTEKDRYAPRTMVVYFPVVGKQGVRRAADVSVWEQATIQKALQAYWSDNMVSATLNFQPNERLSIRQLLEAHEEHFKTVSFLPFSNHGYVQAPYIESTEQEVLSATSRLTTVGEVRGETHEVAAEDKYCSGGVCSVPIPAP